jgi:hypothetical protein
MTDSLEPRLSEGYYGQKEGHYCQKEGHYGQKEGHYGQRRGTMAKGGALWPKEGHYGQRRGTMANGGALWPKEGQEGQKEVYGHMSAYKQFHKVENIVRTESSIVGISRNSVLKVGCMNERH